MRRLFPALLIAAASTAGAQDISDISARIAPQFHSYDIKSPSNIKISEFSVPIFVLVPVTSHLSFDVGSSYTHAEAKGTTTTSSISGLTDTQIRANYTLGSDFVVLTAGVNLPTGQSTVNSDQLAAASLIGNDFLAFPISNMGTGFGGTGGVAIAKPFGDWNIGGGASFRKSSSYDPFDATVTQSTLHYQPGNEVRLRGGVDRAFGTGRVNLGVTYSSFTDDDLGGSVYNTGNRLLTQLGLNNNLGPGMLTLTGWDLYRAAGHLVDSTVTGKENIIAAALAYGLQSGSTTVIEPNIEGRMWTQSEGIPSSALATIGLRAQFSLIGYAVSPSVGYSVGSLGTGGAGSTIKADLTGWHASLGIRLR
ncbi:MAG TPA: hypothetical protein VGM82_18235 [Gemmatimonadaceae bacterium]